MQLKALKKHAKMKGYEIYDTYTDICSATKKRPYMECLKREAKQGKFDVVLVWKFDRFARSVLDLVNSLEEFHEIGVDFISITEEIDTTSPAGKLVFTMMAGVAEFERSLISERVKAGMNAARKRGKHVGRPALDEKKKSQAIELRMERLSYRKIADQLNLSVGTVQKYTKEIDSYCWK